MSRKLVVHVVLLIAVAGAWYAFRPERLFINQRVNEQFPTASAGPTKFNAVCGFGELSGVVQLRNPNGAIKVFCEVAELT